MGVVITLNPPQANNKMTDVPPGLGDVDRRWRARRVRRPVATLATISPTEMHPWVGPVGAAAPG